MRSANSSAIGRYAAMAATLGLVLAPIPALAGPVRLDPGKLKAVRQIDERFQSFNIEMAQIVGGRFWKPYSQMAPTSQALDANRPAGPGPDAFSQQPPTDLSNHRLRALAAGLAPSYVRVSGSWANSVYFQDDDQPALATAPKGYSGVLTRARWRGVLDFSRAVDAKLLTSFAVGAPVRDANGVWTPLQAGPLLAYTKSIGGEIYAAALYNEPNNSAKGDGPAFSRDIAAFRAFAARMAPKMLIVGPGDATPTAFHMTEKLAQEDQLRFEPLPKFDVFNYHFYPAISPRCAAPIPPNGVRAEDALTEEWLAKTDSGIQNRLPLRDKYAPGAPIWMTETAGAACGGAPWDVTFLDTFRYLDQMGRLAKQGVSAIFHNTLAASEYGLIDHDTFEPRPNYWGGLLWRRLMGTTVLDAGELRPGFHVYAQCLRHHPGGVSVMAINNGDADASVAAPQAAALYLLTAPKLQSGTVQLNGQTLAMLSGDRLPTFVPKKLGKGEVSVPSHAIAFIAYPDAHNSACK